MKYIRLPEHRFQWKYASSICAVNCYVAVFRNLSSGTQCLCNESKIVLKCINAYVYVCANDMGSLSLT